MKKRKICIDNCQFSLIRGGRSDLSIPRLRRCADPADGGTCSAPLPSVRFDLRSHYSASLKLESLPSGQPASVSPRLRVRCAVLLRPSAGPAPVRSGGAHLRQIVLQSAPGGCSPARQAHLRPPRLLPFASPWLSYAGAAGCRFAASDLRCVLTSSISLASVTCVPKARPFRCSSLSRQSTLCREPIFRCGSFGRPVPLRLGADPSQAQDQPPGSAQPGRPLSPPLQRFARRACLGLRLLRATSGYSLRRLRQNPFRAHSAPPARTGAGSLWFRLQATCPFTPAGSWRSADSTASLRRPLPGQIALRLDSGYAPFRATCFRSAIPPLPSLPLRPPTAGPSPVRSRRAPLLQIALQCALHKGVLPLRPTPPPGPSSTRFRQTFAGSGLARSLRSSRGARLRPPIRPRGLHLHRFRHIRAESSSIPPLVLCPVRPASLGSAGSPVLCFADPPPAVPVPQAPSERPPARLFPAHPTVLSLYSAAFRCAALRRGAPTFRFRVGRRCVSAPFRSAPGKNGFPGCGFALRALSAPLLSVKLPVGRFTPMRSAFPVEQEYLYCSQRSQPVGLQTLQTGGSCCYANGGTLLRHQQAESHRLQ